MSERLIKSNLWLRNRIKVTVYVPVPGVMDKSEAPAMGNSPLERDENIMRFAEEMLFPQYFRAAKKIIGRYEQSQMPLRYLKGQEIDVLPMVERLGCYSIVTGKIALDNDGMIDIRKEGSGAKIFGHEMGHKIVCVKDSDELLRNVTNYFSINCKWAHEIVADLAGEIIAADDTASNLSYLDEKAKKYFKRQILKLAWS